MKEPTNQPECEHDWKEEYYGIRCSKCGLFYPDGCEPWMPDDPSVAELQRIRTLGDNGLEEE